MNWQRSTRCNNATCVEVAHDETVVLVRDSKNPNGKRLSFSHEEWQAFLDGAKAGEFDLPQRGGTERQAFWPDMEG